ncbi:hypothetical protein ACJX0J_039109, partial [Zea mays]
TARSSISGDEAVHMFSPEKPTNRQPCYYQSSYSLLKKKAFYVRSISVITTSGAPSCSIHGIHIWWWCFGTCLSARCMPALFLALHADSAVHLEFDEVYTIKQ